jgi:hypothetical protein
MPMSQDEAATTYRALADMATTRGFQWVLVQVEEKIALGKVTTRRLRVREEGVFFADRFEEGQSVSLKRRPPDVFAISEEYSHRERLLLLIESLELAIPQLNRIALEVVSFWAREADSAAVVFTPEAPVKEGFQLARSDVLSRKEASEKLLHLLHELRQEVQ